MLIYGRKGVVDATDVDSDWSVNVEAYCQLGSSIEQAMLLASTKIWDLSKKRNVRTWNPLLVNYLPEDDLTTLAGIIFLGKDCTWQKCDRCAIIVNKTKFMGVGEALADSILEEY